MYRVRGLANYIQYYQNDIFHLFFGNAETVYDKTNTYVMTVRSIVGWDGSLEMVNIPAFVSLLSGDRKPQIRFYGNRHSGYGNH